MDPLKIALLMELDKMPSIYVTPLVSLENAVRWAVVPQPTYTEIRQAIDELEAAGLISSVTNSLFGRRLSITDAGRAALKA